MELERKDSLIGEKIRGYLIEKKLGEGGFGTVYLAVNPTIERKAAVKILHRECSDSEAVINRFISEARAVNKINHPNIIQVFDFDRLDDGRFYFMMEYIEGQELSALMAGDPPLSIPQILALLDPVTRGLEAAHLCDIVHRDLKPENIMVYDGWDNISVKILDFGIAKLSESTDSERRTKTGQLLGTPAYMSPEQAKGEKNTVTHLSDIYSLGVIIYEMVSGTLPVKGETIMALLLNILTQIPEDLHQLNPEIPKNFSDIILSALEKDPQKRPQSARGFFEALVQAAVEAGYILDGVVSRDLSSAVTLDMVSKRTPTQQPQLQKTLPQTMEPSPAPNKTSSAKNPSKEIEDHAPPSGGRLGRTLALFAAVSLALILATIFGYQKFFSKPTATPAPTQKRYRLHSQQSGLDNPLFVVVPDDDQQYQGSLINQVLYLDGEPRGVILTSSDATAVSLLDKHRDHLYTLYTPPGFLCRPEVLERVIAAAGRHPVFLGLVPEKGEQQQSCLNRLARLPLYLEIPSNLGSFYHLHLKGFTDLRGLILHGSEVTDTTLSYLKKQNNIEYLSLRESSVTDRGFSYLTRMFQLKTLDLSSGKKFSGSGLTALASLRLKVLNLAGTRITDQGVGALTSCPSISALDLRNNPQITDRGLARLAQLKNLAALRIGGSVTVLKLEKDPIGTLGKIFTLREKDFNLPQKGTSNTVTPESLLNSKAAKTFKGVFDQDKPITSAITPVGIASLSPLPHLTSMTLGPVRGKPSDIAHALSKIHSLRTLTLIDMKNSCALQKSLNSKVPKVTVRGASCQP
ncbi:protein kinase [Myxococcota bacterium]|nr:protein kinase [Myxococcota bacterium]MBU1535277.1 protein kinase [Myxococcota bacterium]